MAEQCVLIAEGNDQLRKRLCDKLIDAGVSFDSVADGRAAIDKLAERVYAMMILDLSLPLLDGVSVIAGVRNLRLADRPMLLVTANSGPMPALDSDLVQMVLRKPYDARQIADVIASCLRAVAEQRKRLAVRRIDESRDRAEI